MKKSETQKIKYSFLEIPRHSNLPRKKLPLIEIKSKKIGQVVWLTSCVHGDEVGGMVVIQEISKRLKTESLLCGSLFALPLLNPAGFEKMSRHIESGGDDLNRSFPGDRKGNLAQRLADKIFTAVIKTKPTLVLDLHNDWIKSIPYILLDPKSIAKNKKIYKTAETFARKTGFLVIREKEETKNLAEMKKTLSGCLIQEGIPALTLELGEAYLVNEKNVEDGVRAIFRILSYLKMTKPIQEKLNYKIPAKLKNKILNYSEQRAKSTRGIIRFLVKPGDLVKKGQVTARVYDVLGKLQENIVTRNNGIVLGHSDYSVVFPDTEIIALGI